MVDLAVGDRLAARLSVERVGVFDPDNDSGASLVRASRKALHERGDGGYTASADDRNDRAVALTLCGLGDDQTAQVAGEDARLDILERQTGCIRAPGERCALQSRIDEHELRSRKILHLWREDRLQIAARENQVVVVGAKLLDNAENAFREWTEDKNLRVELVLAMCAQKPVDERRLGRVASPDDWPLC